MNFSNLRFGAMGVACAMRKMVVTVDQNGLKALSTAYGALALLAGGSALSAEPRTLPTKTVPENVTMDAPGVRRYMTEAYHWRQNLDLFYPFAPFRMGWVQPINALPTYNARQHISQGYSNGNQTVTPNRLPTSGPDSRPRGSVAQGQGQETAAFLLATTTIEERPEHKIREKEIATLGNNIGKKGKATVKTKFQFHPSLEQTTGDIQFDVSANSVNPPSVPHSYLSNEEHNTAGAVTHNLTILTLEDQDGKMSTSLVDHVFASVTPGERNNPSGSVTVTTTLSDPFVFSDSDAEAPYLFVPEGLDYSFSLSAETAFPATFAPDSSSSGAVASETFMLFRARVAPGTIPEPDEFWDDGLLGAIDLFTLTITSDVNHNVISLLTFGEATADFALDFRDHLGQVFDPTNLGDVDAIENFISAGFTSGTVLADLNDIFTVGFDPSDSLGSLLGGFTYGVENSAILTAVEIPVPGSLTVLALGGLLVTRRRRR